MADDADFWLNSELNLPQENEKDDDSIPDTSDFDSSDEELYRLASKRYSNRPPAELCFASPPAVAALKELGTFSSGNNQPPDEPCFVSPPAVAALEELGTSSSSNNQPPDEPCFALPPAVAALEELGTSSSSNNQPPDEPCFVSPPAVAAFEELGTSSSSNNQPPDEPCFASPPPLASPEEQGTSSNNNVNKRKSKKETRKIKRQKGEEYTAAQGSVIRAKKCSENPCGCKLECTKSISIERRKVIFQGFYKLDWTSKNAFVSRSIEIKDKQRQYTKSENSRRNKTRVYKLLDDHGNDQTVCKKYFQETLDISDGTITNILHRSLATGAPTPSRSGKHTPMNKTKSADLTYVCNFIEKFPTYVSHYRRANSSKLYLAPTLNKSILYRLYKTNCEENNKIPVSEFVFRDVFKNNFSHLSFHPPQKDTCGYCDEKNNNIKHSQGVEKNKFQEEKEIHLRKVEAVKTMQNTDTEAARLSDEKQILVFDLQKTLPTPLLTAGEVYYKRQLWTYNLGVHDEKTGIGHMYVWSENEASRGPQEIASCLLYHIKNKLPPNVKELTLYSDSCGGQNRNIKTSLFLLFTLQTHQSLNVINQKFYIPGHSFNSCDRDFGIIEKSKSHADEIFVPEKWVEVIGDSKKKSPKFQVTKMHNNNFYSSESMEKSVTNRKITVDKNKVKWLSMRHIKYQKDQPQKIFFKYSLSDLDDFQVLDIAKKDRGRPSREFSTSLLQLYPNGRCIASEKKKDLISLLKYIPPIYHSFYKNLKGDKDTCDEISLMNHSVGREEEVEEEVDDPEASNSSA